MKGILLAYSIILVCNCVVSNIPKSLNPPLIAYPQAPHLPTNTASFPPLNCQGESIWQQHDVGAIGNTVQFRFQARLNRFCICKHYFRIRSACTLYEVSYETTHNQNSCPVTYHLAQIVQAPINLVSCTNIRLVDIEAAIVLKYMPVPKDGGYCLDSATNTIKWDDQIATRVFGPLGVWFN